ncbi:MAG: hypothetical protein ACRD3J_21765 [Thermoanaerobaculia bacterium]
MLASRSLLRLFLVALTLAPAVGRAQSADDTRYPCRNVHTFDFWVGTYDAMPWDKPDASSGGQLHNAREYDGCVFVERWTSADPKGNMGMSMVFYDTTRKTWRMVWNDDANGSTVFDKGEYTDGAMRFTGWKADPRDPKGSLVMVQNVLENVSPGLIRHIFSISPDSGKTWKVLSDGRFVMRNNRSSLNR